MVPEAGIEPARLAAGDFESPASTNFTTRAGLRRHAIMTYFFRVLHQVFGFLYSDLGPSLVLILFSFFDPVCLWVFLSTASKKLIRT